MVSARRTFCRYERRLVTNLWLIGFHDGEIEDRAWWEVAPVLAGCEFGPGVIPGSVVEMTIAIIRCGGLPIQSAVTSRNETVWRGKRIEYAMTDWDDLSIGPLIRHHNRMSPIRDAYNRRDSFWTWVIQHCAELFSSRREVLFHSNRNLRSCLGMLFIINSIDQLDVAMDGASLWLEFDPFIDKKGAVSIGVDEALPYMRELWTLVCADPAKLRVLPESGLSSSFDRWFLIIQNILRFAVDARGLDAFDEAILSELAAGNTSWNSLLCKVMMQRDPDMGCCESEVCERLIALSQYRSLLPGCQPWECEPPVIMETLHQPDQRGGNLRISSFGLSVIRGEASIPLEYSGWRWVGGVPASELG